MGQVKHLIQIVTFCRHLTFDNCYARLTLGFLSCEYKFVSSIYSVFGRKTTYSLNKTAVCLLLSWDLVVNSLHIVT